MPRRGSLSCRFRRAALFGAALSLLLGGCGAMRAADARHKYIVSQTRDYTYSKPIEQVWPIARQLVFEKGFTIPKAVGAEAGGWALETDWRGKDAGIPDRLLLQGVKVGETTCKVMITRQSRDFAGERDDYMELDLLKRVEPAKAKAIEAEADKEGEKARGP